MDALLWAISEHDDRSVGCVASDVLRLLAQPADSVWLLTIQGVPLPAAAPACILREGDLIVCKLMVHEVIGVTVRVDPSAARILQSASIRSSGPSDAATATKPAVAPQAIPANVSLRQASIALRKESSSSSSSSSDSSDSGSTSSEVSNSSSDASVLPSPPAPRTPATSQTDIAASNHRKPVAAKSAAKAVPRTSSAPPVASSQPKETQPLARDEADEPDGLVIRTAPSAPTLKFVTHRRAGRHLRLLRRAHKVGPCLHQRPPPNLRMYLPS